MDRLVLPNLSSTNLKKLIKLQTKSTPQAAWTQANCTLPTVEQERVQEIQHRLQQERVHLYNEATIWFRAIYPLLQMAEHGDILALAEVPLKAQYATFAVEGVADGVIVAVFWAKLNILTW